MKNIILFLLLLVAISANAQINFNTLPSISTVTPTTPLPTVNTGGNWRKMTADLMRAFIMPRPVTRVSPSNRYVLGYINGSDSLSYIPGGIMSQLPLTNVTIAANTTQFNIQTLEGLNFTTNTWGSGWVNRVSLSRSGASTLSLLKSGQTISISADTAGGARLRWGNIGIQAKADSMFLTTETLDSIANGEVLTVVQKFSDRAYVEFKPSTAGSGGAPSGAAGGDLTGTYPNPTIGNNKVISAYVLDGTLINADLASQTIDSNKIKNGVITNVKLTTNAVDSTKAANLSPNDIAQTGASTNDVLTWTGTKYAPRPSTGGSGSPGGSTTQIQYNNAGAFDGDPKFYFNNTSKVLFVPKIEITDTTDNGTPAAAIRLNRTLSSSISSSGHGFRDQTVFSRPTFAYAAYDDAHTSAVNIDHSISFQGRNTHSAGTILDLQGAGMYPNLTGGSATNIKVYESKPVITGASTTATNLYGYNARTPGISGGATVSNYYAFFVENNAPSTNSYAFYQAAGSAPSQFTGTLNANFVGANIRLKADGTNANDGGFYVSSVGNLNFGNWDATKGFSVAGATGNITQLGSGTIQTGRIGINTTVHASAAINVSGTGIVSGLLTLNATGGNVRFKGANTTDGDGGLIATSGGDIYYSNWDINKGIVIKAGTGNINTLGFGKFGAGGVTTPTAMIHPAASTTSAASLRIPTGTAPTSPNEGDIWQTSNDLHFYTASTDAILARVLKGSATLDFPSTGSNSSSDLTLTVTGAADGDVVSLGVPNASATVGLFFAWVSATNTVTVRFHNASGGGVDPASGTFKVTVTK